MREIKLSDSLRNPESVTRRPLAVLVDENKSRFLLDLFSEPDFHSHFRIFVLDLLRMRRSNRHRLFRFRERLARRDNADLERRSEARTVLDVCSRIKARQIVSVDNKLELLTTIVELAGPDHIQCSVVQMGSNPVHRSREARLGARKVPVTMFSWGNRELDEYVRAGTVPEKIQPVGSLKFGLARRNGALSGLGRTKTWDICLVSMFASTRIPHRNPSDSVRYEQMTMPAIVSILKPIVLRHQLKVVVALKAGQGVIVNASDEEEIDFYKSQFGSLVELSNSAVPYASYAAASASRLVIARNSGLLSEFLGSDSRVLYVNPTPFAKFDAPSEIPFRLSQPSESELEAAIFRLLEMSEETYDAHVRPIKSRFCVNSDRSIELLNDQLTGLSRKLERAQGRRLQSS